MSTFKLYQDQDKQLVNDASRLANENTGLEF